jgi:CxxC-x17-CxxC domain-containing protein
MSYEDKTLVCVQCKKEFVFTAGEQEYFAQRRLSSEPKRCKECRKAKRQKQNVQDNGVYRSPAFEDSAPKHQKIRGRHGKPPRDSAYKQDQTPDKNAGVYRSPAFRDADQLRPDQEYRSPGFREYAAIKPEEEYRAPGFRESASMDLKQEYRAPGFQDTEKKYLDETPMFTINCASCGKQDMVPFLPEESDIVLCKQCFAAKRKEQAEACGKSDED